MKYCDEIFFSISYYKKKYSKHHVMMKVITMHEYRDLKMKDKYYIKLEITIRCIKFVDLIKNSIQQS